MSRTPNWFSLADAAERVHVDVETVRLAICQGELHPHKFGMTTMVVDGELLQWAQRREFQRRRVTTFRAPVVEESVEEFSVDDWLRQTSLPGQSPS